MPTMFRRFQRKRSVRDFGQLDESPVHVANEKPTGIRYGAPPSISTEGARSPVFDDGPLLDSQVNNKHSSGTLKAYKPATGTLARGPSISTASTASTAAPPPIRGGNGGGVRSPVQYSPTQSRSTPPTSAGSPEHSRASLSKQRSPTSRLQPTPFEHDNDGLDEFDHPVSPEDIPAGVWNASANSISNSASDRGQRRDRIGMAIKDRVAIVTGAASGIGLATCIALEQDHWCVLGVDTSRMPKDLEESPSFHYFQTDVTSAEAPRFILEAARSRFSGKVTALVNSAGVVDTLKCVDTLDMDEWKHVMETNLTAPVRLMGAVVRHFVEHGEPVGGSIVNIGSYAGISGGVGGVAHTASKHGLVGVTKNTAFRFKHSKIRCNIICPGAVRSNIRDSVDPTQTDFDAAEVFKTVREAAHPEDLRLEPEQIASMCVYLVSDASRGVNGAVIPVDNGWSTI